MNIREEVKKYRDTKADIERLKVEIETLKLDKMPSNIQIVSDMPSVHSTESKTERTVIDIAEDEEIQTKEIEIKKLELRLKMVESQLIRLDNEERDYIGYYTKGVTQEELSKKYYIEVESVQKRIQRILDKVEGNFKRIA